MKSFKKILCILCSFAFIVQLSACSKKNNTPAETTEKQETKNTENIEYKENWFIAPNIQAQAIYPLALSDFNESTNHYDVSFGNYYVIKKDDKFGLIDSNGDLVFEPQFDSIETCSNPEHDGYYATVVESEYYTSTYSISVSGYKDWVYPHTCEGFSGYAYRWNESDSSTYCISINGENKYTVMLSPSLPETMVVYDGTDLTDKYVLVNSGKAVGSDTYTNVGVFTGGVAAVKKNGKWGYIDSEGKEILPFEFDAVEGYNALNCEAATPYECSEGYLTVLKNGKYGIYSSDGDMIVPCQYASLTTVHNGRAFASKDGKTWGILIVDKKISNGIAPEDSTSDGTY